MDENIKINVWSKLILGGTRYVLGILIIASGVITLLFLGKDPMAIAHSIFHPLLTFFVTPQIIIGFYFMFTGKWRPRIDFTLFLIATVLIYAFYTFAINFNA